MYILSSVLYIVYLLQVGSFNDWRLQNIQKVNFRGRLIWSSV